jgi:hypothetical protein
MLHKETVERETFELLTKLMQDEKLKAFNLVGGTALALYLGHRKSIDLDLFTQNEFDAKDLEKYMFERYNFETTVFNKNTLMGFVAGIKIDFITYNYPFLEQPLQSDEGIRICSMIDIAAMKLSVIADAGTRLKDFVDVACLSSSFSLTEMLQAYKNKYPRADIIRPLRGLTYFNDINFDVKIQMINSSFKWKLVEKRLNEMIKKKNTVFPNLF